MFKETIKQGKKGDRFTDLLWYASYRSYTLNDDEKLRRAFPIPVKYPTEKKTSILYKGCEPIAVC